MEADIVFKYFPNLSQTQKDQFNQLYSLYEEWNAMINVISRKDIEQLYVRHVLHSLSVAKVISFSPGTKILDVGTGGGFPGIPLAIIFPECTFHLVDSIGKKIKVVNEVASSIQLKNLTGKHQRAEKAQGSFDFVVSRAVARTKLVHAWINKKISRNNFNQLNNGMILLKGGDLSQELKEFNRPYQLISISKFFDEEFFDTKSIVYASIPSKHS